jgi:hypothetical protein
LKSEFRQGRLDNESKEIEVNLIDGYLTGKRVYPQADPKTLKTNTILFDGYLTETK